MYFVNYLSFFWFSLVSLGHQCPPGMYCPVTKANPQKCPKGFYCPLDTQTPFPCPIGTYNPQEGLTGRFYGNYVQCNRCKLYKLCYHEFIRFCIKSLRKKCPYSQFFWSVFPRNWPEYEDLQSQYPYSVRPNIAAW